MIGPSGNNGWLVLVVALRGMAADKTGFSGCRQHLFESGLDNNCGFSNGFSG